MYSQYIPGAIMYSVKSLPDVIAELEDVAKTAISNNVAYQKLASSLLATAPFIASRHQNHPSST